MKIWNLFSSLLMFILEELRFSYGQNTPVQLLKYKDKCCDSEIGSQQLGNQTNNVLVFNSSSEIFSFNETSDKDFKFNPKWIDVWKLVDQFRFFHRINKSKFNNIIENVKHNQSTEEFENDQLNSTSYEDFKTRMSGSRKLSGLVDRIMNRNERLTMKFEENPLCDNSKGNFINVCGQCVTESNNNNTKRVDACGVCEGKNSCRMCNDMPDNLLDDCGQCLKPTSERWNNCTKIIEVIPSVIDLAVEKSNITVFLKGIGLEIANLGNLQCSVNSVDGVKNLQVMSTDIKDERVYLSIALNTEVGEYMIICNSTNEEAILPDLEIKLVNSNLLSVISVFPTSIKLGQPLQLDLTVRGVSALLDLICFIYDNNTLVATIPTNKIQGNPLVSNVTCSGLVLKRAALYKIGITFTYSALSKLRDANAKEIVVESDAPVLVKGGFSADLRKIWIEFDKNVNGETSCDALFSEETFLTLGSDAVCVYLGNTLWIFLGENSTIKSGDKIKLKPDTIRSAYGDNNFAPSYNGVISLKIYKSEVNSIKPVYDLVGSNLICPGEKLDPHKFQRSSQNSSSNKTNFSSEILIRTINSEKIKYNATILFQVDNDVMESNKRQRKNLLVWFSVRQLQKSINNQELKHHFSIDNNLLVPDVNYTLILVGKNQFGDTGDKKNFSFSLVKGMTPTDKPIQLLLTGPSRFNVYTDIWIETKIVPSCNPNFELPYNTKYIWKIESNESVLDFPLNFGPKLFLPGGTLEANKKYSISSEVVIKDKNESLLKASFELETYNSYFDIWIGVTNLVIGTGQSLELWASTNLINIAANKIQYTWLCEYNGGSKCFIPGQNSSELFELNKNEFHQKHLRLKAGSLAVGRYNFTVKAVLRDENFFAVTKPTIITVVPGEHPKIQILKFPMRPVNPEDGINISAKISNVKSGCLMEWEAEIETGYDYFDIKSQDSVETKLILPIDSEIRSKEFPLIIPGRNVNDSSMILKEGASYKFTLSVYCGASSHSLASIILYTDILPKPKKLQVKPTEGVALITQFSFSTERAYASARDHPLFYSFGYKIANESSQYIYSSSEWLNTKILLPSASLEGSKILTLLKVCNVRQICSIIEGPEIHTTSPKTLPSASLQMLGLEYVRLLTGHEYNEALSIAVSSLKTLQTLSDKDPYNNVSRQVESAIMSEINILSKSLEEKKLMSVKPAVALLDAATTTLQFIPKTDVALSQIITFKKKILNTFDFNADSGLILSNQNTKDAYGGTNPSPLSLRLKRQNDVLHKKEVLTFDMIKTMMKTSELAIMNLSDSEVVVAETKELLHNVENYVNSLCSQISEENNFIIRTKIAQFSVEKISISNTFTEQIPVPHCSKSCDGGTAYVKLRVHTSDSSKDLDSICFAGVVYPLDYLSQINKVKKTYNDELRQSDIFHLTLKPYLQLIEINNNLLVAKINIPLKNKVDSKVLNLKCLTWADKTGWISDFCTTNEVAVDHVVCSCPVNMYISVFTDEVNKTSANEFEDEIKQLNNETKLTKKPDWEILPLNSPEVLFRIDEDYESTIKDNKREFEENIRTQIINQLKIPPNMFQRLSVSPGSILVTMQLVNGDKSVNEVLPNLVRALNYGELSLSGFDGSRLKVPPQLLQITERQTDGETDSHLGLIVICTILIIFSAIFVSIFITSFVVKRNRDKIAAEIAQNLEETNLPKYRQLYFEDSVEGSCSSISQYNQIKHNKAVAALISSCPKDEHDSGIGIINDPEKNKKFESV